MANGNKCEGLTWFRVAWPVVTFVVVIALGGIGGFAAVQQRVAILETENHNTKEMLTEMKGDLKDIKNILMDPARR